MSDNYEKSAFSPSLPESAAKILGVYRRAVFAEMFYLRDEGGRKYKVTNGRLIGRSGEGFAYSFDMESELYLAEDAPITIQVGLDTVKGSVITCEDFQIIVTLNSRIGDTVPVAYMSAEPWKLLESLNECLSGMDAQKHSIALKLMLEGPARRTQVPIAGVDAGQDSAIHHALEDPITVIWGPPGTGKTHTMAEIAIRYLSQGKSVLAVSHSNVSVDGIASKVAQLMREQGMEEWLDRGEVLRFGHVRDEALAKDRRVSSYNFALHRHSGQARRMKELQKERDLLRSSGKAQSERRVELEREIKSIRKNVAEEEKECVSRARFVATTVSKLYANKFFEGRTYDMVMFDEASMAYVPQVICAAMFARRKMVCVGDFRQLAPIVQAPAAKEDLSHDIFWYLGICDARQRAYQHPWLVMLDEQRRMHPKISNFPSSAFYGNLLRDHDSVIRARDDIADGTPYPGEAMVLVDLLGTYCAAAKNSDNSRFNVLSAAIAFAVALTAEQDNECSVGVIAPYVAQVRLVRAMVQDHRARKMATEIACSTVHQFQGSERDIVVLDMVESFPAQKPGILTSKNENGSVDRLVNVAVTRARGKLVTLSNRQFWESEAVRGRNAFALLARHHAANNYVVSAGNGELSRMLASIDFGPNIKCYQDLAEAQKKFVHDIERASRKVAISIPDGRLSTGLASAVLEAIQKAKLNGVDILMKSGGWQDLPDAWKGLGWQSPDATCPIVMIDDHIIWHGMPLAEGRFVDKNGRGTRVVLHTPLRITGKHTVALIASLTEIELRTVDGKKQALKKRSGNGEVDKTGSGVDGLALMIKKEQKCPKCKAPMTLAKGYKSGKYYLKCSSSRCDEIGYLTTAIIDHYISVKQVRCPKCKSFIWAQLGKYGVFIKCEQGHTLKPDAI